VQRVIGVHGLEGAPVGGVEFGAETLEERSGRLGSDSEPQTSVREAFQPGASSRLVRGSP
jgi:hypothetical protein